MEHVDGGHWQSIQLRVGHLHSRHVGRTCSCGMSHVPLALAAHAGGSDKALPFRGTMGPQAHCGTCLWRDCNMHGSA